MFCERLSELLYRLATGKRIEHHDSLNYERAGKPGLITLCPLHDLLAAEVRRLNHAGPAATVRLPLRFGPDL